MARERLDSRLIFSVGKTSQPNNEKFGKTQQELEQMIGGVIEKVEQTTLALQPKTGDNIARQPKPLAFPIRNFSKYSWTFPADTP
jgi:hypothetical protein